VLVFWKRPAKWRELASIVAVCTLLLATWFGWSIATYGVNPTLKSNTAVTSAEKYSGSNFGKMALNTYDSLVPYVLRGRLHTPQLNTAGIVRDYAFSVFQTNLFFSMGLVGGPVVVWLFLRGMRRGWPEWRFWRVVIPALVFVGLAVVGERDVFGTAHLTLIPVEVLGLSLVAARFSWRPAAGDKHAKAGYALTIALLVGCIIDFSMGVLLQAKMEALENTPQKTVFSAAMRPADVGFQIGRPTPEGLSVAAWENWFLKHRFELYLEFLGKFVNFNPANAADQQTAAHVREGLQKHMEDDQIFWHGWWQRHQFHITFLGDDTADFADILPWILWSFFLALLLLLLRQLRTPAPSIVPVKSRVAGRSRR
jgi:hypothetical protein